MSSSSSAPAPQWTPIPPPVGICGHHCAFPGFLKPQCQDTCCIEIGHNFECRCAVHAVDAFAPPRTLPLRGKNFRDLLLLLRSHNAMAFALPLKRAGLRSPEDLCRATPQLLLALGLPTALIKAAGLDPFALPSFFIPSPTPTAPQSRLRADHPVLNPTSGGCINRAIAASSSNEAREKALEAIDRDVLSQSSQASADSHWRTWCRIAEGWNERPVPLTAPLVRKMMASFKAGGYRSVKAYVSKARQTHILRFGTPPSEDVQLALGMYIRSALRGIGPASLKDAFMLEDITKLGIAPDILQPSACVAPVQMVVLGSWFLTRGIEASAARTSHLTFTQDELGEVSLVNWLLPVSKTDVQARGTTRSLPCVCTPNSPESVILCPLHAAIALGKTVKAYFGAEYAENPDNPLFPNAQGKVLTKEGFILTIRSLLIALNIPLQRLGPDGKLRDRFSEHVLRVSGAQFLARRGMQLICIQLLGRWGSAAILRYIQDAPLAQLPDAAKQAMLNYSMARLQSEFKQKSGQADRDTVLIKKMVDEFNVHLDSAKAMIKRLAALESAPKAKTIPRDMVLNTSTNCLHRILIVDKVNVENSTTFCGFLFFSSPCKIFSPDGSIEGEACKRCNKIFARYFEPWLAQDSSSSEEGGQ